jgi:hypothetical protein
MRPYLAEPGAWSILIDWAAGQAVCTAFAR